MQRPWRTSRHVTALLSLLLAFPFGGRLTPVTHAQEAGRQSGIYHEVPGKTGDEALQRLEATMMRGDAKGGATAALTGGLTGIETIGVLEGAAAELRVEPGAVSFQFVFAPKGQRTPKMPTNLDEALNNNWDTSSMPPNVKSPKELGLVKFEVKDDERIASLGKMGGLMGGRGKPKNLVDLTVTELGTNTYRVTTKAPLAPGEYGFITLEQGAANVWDFGVGAR